MILLDVNVLIYAHREESAEHEQYAEWLGRLVRRPEPFAMSELALGGFVRVVTHKRVFRAPTPLDTALRFCKSLLERSNCARLRPGPKHWSLFEEFCHKVNATGKLVPDAYHAALAIEHGCEFATTDSDFNRFPGLRIAHPLRSAD